MSINQILPHPDFAHGSHNEILEKIQAIEKYVVVLDDWMTSAWGMKQISKLFRLVYLDNILTVVFIVQKMFSHGWEMRTISLNAHTVVLNKNTRDKSQISLFSRQDFSWKFKVPIKSVRTCNKRPTLISSHRSSPPNGREIHSLSQYIPSGKNSVLFASFSIKWRPNGPQNENF